MTSINLIVTLFVAISCLNSVSSAPRCSACQGSDCEAPKNCFYGEVKDYCGRNVCAKGPGQRCGGKWNYHGSCGDGMFCSCGRCSGCSLKTLECYSSTCI